MYQVNRKRRVKPSLYPLKCCLRKRGGYGLREIRYKEYRRLFFCFWVAESLILLDSFRSRCRLKKDLDHLRCWGTEAVYAEPVTKRIL